MSGFRVKILLASIQTDLLRQGASVLVIEPDDASDAGSASFPGIEVRRCSASPLNSDLQVNRQASLCGEFGGAQSSR